MTKHLPLSEFIRGNLEYIIQEWERFATTLTPAADSMTHSELRDHIKEILAFIADDIESPQTNKEQRDKSQGADDQPNHHTIGAIHGSLRFGDGFNVIQMISEYRALRASIVKLWKPDHTLANSEDLMDLNRFHESIDQLVAESLRRFIERLDHSRDLMLGIIGHDIRNPLGAIKMSAQLIPKAGILNEKQAHLASQIEGSSVRIDQIVNDLFDLTRAGIGAGLPVHRSFMDVGTIASQLVTEMRAQYPDRNISLETIGNAEGEWDSIRLGQVFSNLIGNAVQYSPAGSTISVSVKADDKEVMISVHNEGKPIPPKALFSIFNFLIRVKEKDAEQTMEDSSHLGLGLYIVKQIVLSHGGDIDVVSSENAGTTFIATLPKITVNSPARLHELA